MTPRLVIVWRATERCDAACPFCAYDAGLRRPRPAIDGAAALRFGRLVASWARAKGRPAHLSWIGGEPFLWPPLVDVSRDLRRSGLSLGLTTNGRALAGPAAFRFALDTLDELTVSLDGPPEVHDCLRGRPGLGATVLDAVARLREARGGSKRPLLRVNVVLLRPTVARFEETVSLAAASGADEVSFNALGGRERPAFFPANRLRTEDIDALAASLARVREGARRSGVRVLGGGAYLARLRCAATGEKVPVDDCGPGRTFWFIDARGRLAPCAFTVDDYGVPIETLRTRADLEGLPGRLAEARARSRAAPCDDCPSTQVHAKFAASRA